ncbi:hypothetical protein [Marinobacterium lutimaris]|uniref:Uncharacterized protein n=1 Tax=Marinobacterium lutimaris TaxID=568106 RepID=A0A1H6DVE1_9GAMM|nr:hypothetical protein [Marinobacterium lutimaris]SEG89238.1 hypothetical protein SAMN05444390_11139 [Marinobacterium lutimaris]
MNIINRILLAPVPWFEKHTVQDGQFTDRFRRIILIVLTISIVTLLADPVLSLVRFGYPGFSHPFYYVAMTGLIAIMAMLSRPDIETSLLDMKHSNSRVSRTAFKVIMVGYIASLPIVLVWQVLLALISGLAEAREHPNDSRSKSSMAEDYPDIGVDGQALSETDRMVYFMDDMAAPPD